MPLVMGIDIGTSSAKTMVMDESGRPLASASAGYPLHTPFPGWVEQNPEDWWRAVCETIREILRKIRTLTPPRSAGDIAGIALSGQMNGAVFMDSSGMTLRPAMLWLDGRSQRVCDRANEKAGDLLRARAIHVLNPINTLAKILWAREHEPDVYQKTRSVLVPKDWARYRLTGALAADVSDGSVTGALDLYTRQWSGDILDALDVDPALFPPVYESIHVTGAINRETARETGLIEGTPVCAGGGDMACMAVGSGAIKPGVVGVGLGTAGHAIAYAESVSDAAFNRLWPMCHSVPEGYFWLGCSYTGGGSLSWFHQRFGDPFAMLNTLAESVSPGSDGLFFLPWLAGAATPHPNAYARAAWIGLTLSHTRGHLIRAIMEGAAFDLRQSLECFKALELPLDEIRLGEGGVRSNLWRHILVDVFGQDGRMMEIGDASAIGATLIAGVGTGVFESFDVACGRTIHLGEKICCDADRSALYAGLFDRYQALYPALEPWFQGYGEP